MNDGVWLGQMTTAWLQVESRSSRVMEFELDPPSKPILFLSSTPYWFTYMQNWTNHVHHQEHYAVESLNSLVNTCSTAVVDADLSFDDMII